MLGEVVAIGYGRAKKSDLTGSVTAIKPDEKNHGLEVNAQDMIQGKIAGVNVTSNDGTPGGGATIRIRGGSSLNASNDPLIVIDGLSMDTYGVQGLANPLSLVNPNDIESFTVLKDASATAIYGSRASNGVIIITTKKGHAGQKARVSYNGTLSVATRKSVTEVLDGETFTQLVKDLYGEDSDAYNALGYYDADGNKRYADTDWQDEIYRTAASTDQNITVSGGFKNVPYRVSVGYTGQNGILRNSGVERFTGSVNLSPSLLDDHLKLNINAKGMYARTRYADGGEVGASRYMDPTKAVTSDYYIYKNYFGGYVEWYQAADLNDPTWPYSTNRNATVNPVAIQQQYNHFAHSRTFLGNIEADYKVHSLEGLHLHANGGIDLAGGDEYWDITQNSALYENSVTTNYYGYHGKSLKHSYNMSLSLYAQYLKDIGEAHHFDVMAGYEYQKFHVMTDYDHYGWLHSTNTAYDASNSENNKYNNVSEGTVTEYKSENYLVSFFGRFNYSLLDRYLLTVTLRDDGSSRFSKENRWGLFPSVALAWRIKDEAFLKDVDFLSDLKLRLGYGITGQQEGIGDYTYIATYTANIDHAYYQILGDGTTYRPDAYNGDLTWEKTTTYNAGLDIGFLKDRVVINADWYYRKTTDLINTVYVKPGSNFKNKVTSNIGSLHNTGVEIGTVIRAVETTDWTWEVNYNITYNDNEIDDINVSSDGTPVLTGDNAGGGTGNQVMANGVGHPANSFYVYQQAYDADGNPIQNTFVDRNGDGVISSSDRYFYYKPAADVTMGLGSKLTYKNWDLSFSARAALGNYVYNNNAAGACRVGAGNIYTNQYLQNATVDAYNLGFTSPTTEQMLSDYWVENASFVKLDNITLGYNFTGFGRGKNYNGISGRVYATVQNVATITDYSGIDPEVAGGIDDNLYPRPFTTIVGLNLNF